MRVDRINGPRYTDFEEELSETNNQDEIEFRKNEVFVPATDTAGSASGTGTGSGAGF